MLRLLYLGIFKYTIVYLKKLNEKAYKLSILQYTMASEKQEISTIKLTKQTKERLSKLKVYKNETFEEIIESMLNTFNICKQDPEKAKQRLQHLDEQRKLNFPNN